MTAEKSGMGDMDGERPFIPVNIALLTISDTRTFADDISGQTLAERIKKAGHILAAHSIVRDEIEEIRHTVMDWIANEDMDVIITSGGTGFTGRDVTIEAITPLFEKRMDGFATLFQYISYDKIGSSAIQSRATGGLANSTYIFSLPGSTSACTDAWDGILQDQLDYRHRPCNFIEIIPRLDEHLKRGPK